MTTVEFNSTSEADTDRLGAILAEELPPGSVIALDGTLGAGKTRLVQAIAAGFNVPRDQVLSPTFVLCHQYVGDLTLYHLDAYRIDSLDEFYELGVEEMIDAGGLVLIEWAAKVIDALPSNRFQIKASCEGETLRRFAITATGQAEEQALGENQTPARPNRVTRLARFGLGC